MNFSNGFETQFIDNLQAYSISNQINEFSTFQQGCFCEYNLDLKNPNNTNIKSINQVCGQTFPRLQMCVW